MLGLPYLIALKAEALQRAGRASEALEAIRDAEAETNRSGVRWLSSEVHRLRGVFLARTGAHETQIADSFRVAIRIAKQQESISFVARAEKSYEEFRSLVTFRVSKKPG